MKRNFKKIGAILLATAAAMALTACDLGGGLTDSRDGKSYKTVKIGEKVWMAENLNYQTSDSKCHESKQENCDKYGRLYIWREALTACPEGWHLPSKEDFEELRTVAGQKLTERVETALMLSGLRRCLLAATTAAATISTSRASSRSFGLLRRTI